MSITANHLAKVGPKRNVLNSIIQEQLIIIDDILLRSNRDWGKNRIVHDLPINLIIPGIEKRDAQRVVYASIIKSLQSRGFAVRIALHTDKTTLYVEWETNISSEAMQATTDLISSVLVPKSPPSS